MFGCSCKSSGPPASSTSRKIAAEVRGLAGDLQAIALGCEPRNHSSCIGEVSAEHHGLGRHSQAMLLELGANAGQT
eukprot:9418113-Pyramimonas_sp.AAC.1